MSISSISNQNIYRSYESLASGKRINRASDDAAGLAIANKLESQSNSYDVGIRNAGTSQDMLKVAARLAQLRKVCSGFGNLAYRLPMVFIRTPTGGRSRRKSIS